MKKKGKNQDTQAIFLMASEPTATYGTRNYVHVPEQNPETRQDILTNTVSVDEYFDELIMQVSKDYENL